ncbi:irregular chiasm C-roughest protein [Caerostris darwini]|uniref:Irregular chiasm C-roughest protein n=1 Tax=Caerostris darwini TaxID=1538125 RepID=A0AAV4TWE7_9ARAC|nr:irregular chiasm C-roughest protein [Caerostris darwini]
MTAVQTGEVFLVAIILDSRMWWTIGYRRWFSRRVQKLPRLTCPLVTILLISSVFLEGCVLKVNAQNTPDSKSRNGKPPQEFAIEPADRTAIVGKPAVLPCRVLNKVGTLQWTRDGFGLGSDRELRGFPRYTMVGSDDEGDFSLHISSVTLEDNAMFQCQVGAADGVAGIRSRNAAFTVFVPPEPPKIVQGDFLRTTAGMTVELTCESHAGKPKAELTWGRQRANAALKWTLTPRREHDGKTFTCRSENPALTQPLHARISLEVKYPPEITLKVSSDKIMEHDNVKFTCEAVANPGDVNIKWQRNDEVIVGDHSTTYTITRVTREYNKDTISCEVSNAVGTTKSTHTLNVLYGPVFRSTIENVAADIGSEVTLSCDVDGNPKPDTVWTFEGSDAVLSTQSKLVIPQLTLDRAGRYTCRATVVGFAEISTDVLVFIKGPPRVRSDPVQYGIEGEVVKLQCVIASVPPPTRILWSRNSQHVDIDNNDGYEIVEDKIAGGVKNILIIHNADEDDFGQYNCTVWNAFGQDSMLILLKKQKSLPMLIILAGVIGGIVFIVSVTIVIILCLRRKSVIKDEDYGCEKKTKQSDSASSGDSDFKAEIRTASSLSNNEHDRSWEESSDRAQDNNIFKYNPNDYPETNFPPKPESQVNNGYIPYVDYTRDYTPPAVPPTGGVRDSGLYGSPPQSLSDLSHTVDPRYRAGYANPYLRNSASNLPLPPPPQGGQVFVTSTWGGHHTPSPTSPAAAGQQPSSQQSQNPAQNRYITAQQGQTHLKPGTLATHV